MKRENHLVSGAEKKPVLLDIHFAKEAEAPLVIYAHGFKGFKDFGCNNLVAKHFAENGFHFLKFNFSHNGTTPDHPEDFVDLDAFSRNTFSYELDDLGFVIDFCETIFSKESMQQLSLIGHSRGGGIVLLKANEESRVKKVISWAGVNEYGKFWDEESMKNWKKEGVMYVPNARTKQQMPMRYDIYEDFFAHQERLDIPQAIKNIQQPLLIVHGDADETVSVNQALQSKMWNPAASLEIIIGANHTFGAKHPRLQAEMPIHLQQTVNKTISFLKK